MSMIESLILPMRAEPGITSYPLDYLIDKPDEVRWRAAWNKDWEGEVKGIELRCYPVIKTTPQGAWIDQYAYHNGAWKLSGQKRWVSNDGGQAWAKPTRSDAVNSIAYRYQRWASRMQRDINYFRACGQVLGVLMPEKKQLADDMLTLVASTISDFTPHSQAKTNPPQTPREE